MQLTRAHVMPVCVPAFACISYCSYNTVCARRACINATCTPTQGWQWLFIIESLPTLFLALWVWRTLSPSPAGCSFLSASDRAWLVDHCAARDAARQSSGSRGTLGGALVEGRLWWMGVTGLMYTCAKYGAYSM